VAEKLTTNRNLVELITAQIAGIKALISRIEQPVSDKIIEMILQADKIFITGQGRSGLVAQCLATRLAQIGFTVHIPGQATCQKIEKPDLLIAFSCKGTTKTVVEYARVSQGVGAKIAVVTAFEDSTLAELADEVVLVPSDDEDIRAVCRYPVGPNNNTLFEQAALLYVDALVYILMDRKGICKSIISQRHTNLE
jgi:6-phospho-3-hexuloisomerase